MSDFAGPLLPLLLWVKGLLFYASLRSGRGEGHGSDGELVAKINGIEGMSPAEITFELQRGGKFVNYSYCVSAIVITFRRGSDIYFVRSGDSRLAKGLPWTLLSLVAGWWGIPWGPIFTIQSLYVNLRGGNDVTDQVASALHLSVNQDQLTANPS